MKGRAHRPLHDQLFFGDAEIERGLLVPPSSRDKLEIYAKALGLKPGSADWVEFFDRAAACKGEIPLEIMSDSQLVEKLPLIFRIIRGKRVTDKHLEELAELIRKSHSMSRLFSNSN